MKAKERTFLLPNGKRVVIHRICLKRNIAEVYEVSNPYHVSLNDLKEVK
jgi:hypothetical protein